MLLETGGMPPKEAADLKDDKGRSAIHFAAGCNPCKAAIETILREGGPEQLRAKCNDGEMPLHKLARNGLAAFAARCCWSERLWFIGRPGGQHSGGGVCHA